MKEITTDERGRINLGKELIERYGKRFWIAPSKDEIILIPVPKDPIKDLRELGRRAGLHKMSLKEIKKMIEEEATKEALSNLERVHRR
jgi:hypothetical protein